MGNLIVINVAKATNERDGIEIEGTGRIPQSTVGLNVAPIKVLVQLNCHYRACSDIERSFG